MTRRPRDFAAGVYHLAAHGSSDRPLFLEDADRAAFLELLDFTWKRYGLELISYVLMTNHYHVLTGIPDKRLSTALQVLHGRYSRNHNKRHSRSAHLFRAHAFTRRLRDDDDLLTTERYVARNPVRAEIVSRALDWSWSSSQAHAGFSSSPVLLSEERLCGAFGEHISWRRHYADFVNAFNKKGPVSGAFR